MPKKPVEASKTMMITVTNKDKQEITYTVPNFDISYEMDKETAVMVLHMGKLEGLKLGDRINLTIMATTDPTPRTANNVVSLGYLMQRWAFGSCELIREDPPTFVGWRILYVSNMLLEQWDYG